MTDTTATTVMNTVPDNLTGRELFMGDMSNPGTLDITENVAAFYIGGNTPWTWTETQIARQTAQWRHPVWVYGLNKGGDGGILEGHKIVNQLRALRVPEGCSVSVDMEVSVDAAYLTEAAKILADAKYALSVYGSRDYVVKNPLLSGGRWVADWLDSGKPHLTGVPGEWACQYVPAGKNGNPEAWDLSVVKSTARLWNPQETVTMFGVLVEIPSGRTRQVSSVNSGQTWR